MAARPATTFMVLTMSLAASRGAAEAPLTLADLERLALERNPTLAQAMATVAAADGQRQQAGLFPNPTLSYEGEDLRKREFVRGDHHTVFLGLDLPLLGRLKKSGAVAGHEQARAGLELEVQRQRVRNAVRSLHYDVLVARSVLQTREELARIAAEAVSVSQELYNVGQADRPDVSPPRWRRQRRGPPRPRRDTGIASAEPRGGGGGGARPRPRPGQRRPRGGRCRRRARDVDALLAGPEAKRPSPARSASGRRWSAHGPTAWATCGWRWATADDHDTVHGARRLDLAGPDRPCPCRCSIACRAGRRKRRAARSGRRPRLRLRAVPRRARSPASRPATAPPASVPEPTARRSCLAPRRWIRLYEAKFKEVAAAYPQVLIARRAAAQARLEYLDALGRALHHRVLLEGFLLEGGLVPPAGAGAEPEGLAAGIERGE